MIQYRLTRHYSGPGGPLQPGVHELSPMLQNRLQLMGLVEPVKPKRKRKASTPAAEQVSEPQQSDD